MEKTISNLKHLPKLQLPAMATKAVTLPKIEAVPKLPRLATRTQASYETERRRVIAAQEEAARLAKEESYKKLTGVVDANDPYAINSVADVIFNRKGKEKRYGEFAKVLHKIPVLGDLATAYVAYIDKTIVSPWANILTGDFKALGINTLTNFTETLDILANPVKSLVAPLVAKNKEEPKYQLPWYERLGSSIGFTDSGRYNYDYDTGFWLSDFGLEMISDPLNIVTLFTGGSVKELLETAGTALAKKTGQEFGEAATESIFKVITKAGLKTTLKTGGEITADYLRKTIAKKFGLKTVKRVFSLRKIGNNIASTAKRLAKLSGDDALRKLVQELDIALAASKGITDDTVKSIIKQIGDVSKNLASAGLNDNSLKVLKKLSSLTDEFTDIAEYSLKNFLLELFGSTADDMNKVLTNEAKKESKGLRKMLKAASKAQDLDAVKNIQEQLSILLSDPNSIKRYKKLFNVDDLATLIDSLDDIPFADYLEKANAFIQRSRAFKLAKAMDAIAEGTKVVDDVIFKAALYSSAPLVPFAVKYLRPSVGSLVTKVSKTAFGKYVINWLIKRIESVDDFFKSKFGNATVLIHKDLEEAYARIFKEFDILSGSKLSDSGFEKELAQSIYNDTFKWLRGYGNPNSYVPTLGSTEPDLKPVNILNASFEEQKNQIWGLYNKQFTELGVTEDQAVDYFFKEMDKMGQLGFGINPLQDWSITEYVQQLKVTDALITARNAYKDFDEVLRRGNLGGKVKTQSEVLKYVMDFDSSYITNPKSAWQKSVDILSTIRPQYNNFDDIDSVESFINKTFPTKVFYSRKRGIRTRINEDLKSFSDATEKVGIALKELEHLKELKAESWIIQAQDDALTDALKSLQGSASRLRSSLIDYSKIEAFKDTEFAPLFDQIQKIASPYYGQRYQTNYEFSNYLEIASSPRTQTLEILKDKDFQGLIDSLRPGGEAFKMLELARLEQQKYLKDEHAKDFAKQILSKIEFVFNTVSSIDAYVEHMALVKQSELPEFLQEIYLDVLSEMSIRDASHFLQNFDANSAEVVRRMNEKLTSRYATHTYELDYFAAQLLDLEGFKATAQRYFNSSRTLADEIDLIEATYRAKVLPEFSLKVKDDLGNETNQYLYREYNAYKDKQKVFLSLKTSGDNPNLDSISDLSFKSGDTRWSFDTTKTEEDNILELYKQLKTVSEKGETVFIAYKPNSQEIDFLQTRVYELMEETYAKGLGDPELYKEYQAAKRRKASPEELAEIYEQMQDTMNPEAQHLFHNLVEAQHWFERNLYYSNLSCTDLLKKFDDVPTVGEFYRDIKERFLMSYMHRQAFNGGNINLTIDKSFLDKLKEIPLFELDKLNVSIDSLYDTFSRVQNFDSTIFARSGVYASSGRMLIDGNYYKKGVRSSNIATINAHEIKISDKAQLLNLNENNRWVYKNTVLPETVTTANEAVRYLKSIGEEYAPTWRALNPEQQLSTYPVMINGKVTLQQIEGTAPIVVKKYIDIPLVKNFFLDDSTATRLNLKHQYHFTLIAEQISDILSQIADPSTIDEIAPVIERIWNEVIPYAKNYENSWSPYSFLKDDLNIYQKYAVLVAMLKDNTPGTPNHLIKLRLDDSFLSTTTNDDLIVRASKLFYNPEYYLSNKSYFRRLYEENHRNSNLGYSDNTFSRTSYIDHIYGSEERGTVVYARELFEAIEEVNQDVINSTKAFKVALERPKTGGQFRSVYAPGMQRHATLGMSLINLNNKLVETANKFREGPEFDAFISCDKQVVNNLEDLCLKQVLELSPESLTSFVQYQGKGVVVIPVGKYLKDTTAHNFDLRPDIKQFLALYKDYNSDVLGIKRSGDNLILYIKDYKLHVKQKDIPYQVLNPIDINVAFKRAYGYPMSSVNAEQFANDLASLRFRYATDSLEYQDQLNLLYRKYASLYDITTKQSAFLFQHYEDIEDLRKAYKAHYDSLNKLSLDYDAQYSYKQGGYGRTIDFQTYKSILDQLPKDVRKEMNLVEDLEVEKIFNTDGGDIFNFTTLGRANYRLELEPYASSNYQSIMANTYRSMAYNLSAATQYAQFYFEDSPWTLSNFFQYAKTEEEMLSAIKLSDAYTVSTLHINEKGLPVVKELKINTIEDLRKAIKSNAILTPTTTYGSISQTLNNKRWSNSKFKWFHKLSYYTKMAMLVLNPGFIFRNIIDSTLKNYLVFKEKDQVFANYLEAIDLHRRYQETVDMLFAINKDHPFRPDTMDIVLKDSTSLLTEEQFMFIHNFYENGPSAGSISQVSDYYMQQAINKGTLKQSALQKTIDVLMKPTKDIEDITRFASYIESTKRGLTNIDAFELIRKTHFDYATKTDIQYLLELVFPFYSFKLKNFEFWLEYASSNPAVTYNLLQMATNEWNWEDIDFERIEYYQSQLNHMTQANIQLNKQGLTLKINPSMMDPVNLMLNPLETLSGSVAPWVQPIVDAIQEKEPYGYDKLAGTVAGAALATVPGLGMPGMAIASGSQYASRLTSGKRAYDRTGSVLPLVLPSVFGSVKTPTQYGKASYTNSRAFSDPEKRRPRRVNIYNKYYTDTGKNRWKIRFYPIDAATVQYRIRDNYNRFR